MLEFICNRARGEHALGFSFGLGNMGIGRATFLPSSSGFGPSKPSFHKLKKNNSGEFNAVWVVIPGETAFGRCGLRV